MPKTPTKTFGMRTPTDLYEKLLFDIERARNSGSSAPAKYAAFDCAVDAWHLVDWVQQSISDEHSLRLCGKKPDHKKWYPNFIKINGDRLPDLELCRQIANSVKHFVILRGEDRSDLSTGSAIKFTPPFRADKPETWSETKASPYIYMKIGDEKYGVVELFSEMAAQWKNFLIEEMLYDPEPNYPD